MSVSQEPAMQTYFGIVTVVKKHHLFQLYDQSQVDIYHSIFSYLNMDSN